VKRITIERDDQSCKPQFALVFWTSVLRSAAMFAAGTVVGGKYRIDHVLGRGGMGVIAAATHVQLHQRVALKFLHPEYATSSDVVERFVREARAAAALRSDHVCRVSDVGALDDGTPYIVMELLEGSDLARLLARSGPLPVQRACGYLLEACVGLAEAHALGIVHRDLKPANLFLAQRPGAAAIVKVLDFGIAKAPGADGTDFSLTATKGVLGSPGYMSPEQLRSTRDVDVRSDVWSLGVILFELVSGRPPFNAESITDLAIRVWTDPRPPFVGRMPNGFDEVIDRCLAKRPGDRFPDLASLAHALAPYAGREGAELATMVSRMLGVAPGHGDALAGGLATIPPIGYSAPPMPRAGPPMPTTLGSSAASLPRRHEPRARWGLIAGVAVVLIAGVATVAVVQRGGHDELTPRPASQPTSPPAAAPAPSETPAPPAQTATTAPPAPTTPPVPTPPPAPVTLSAPTLASEAPTAPATLDAGVAPPASAPTTATVDRGDVPGEATAKKPEPPAKKPDGAKKKPTKKPAQQTEDFGASRY
jgi:eukaryotic-like serine/threonine-protein kinase